MSGIYWRLVSNEENAHTIYNITNLDVHNLSVDARSGNNSQFITLDGEGQYQHDNGSDEPYKRAHLLQDDFKLRQLVELATFWSAQSSVVLVVEETLGTHNGRVVTGSFVGGEGG